MPLFDYAIVSLVFSSLILLNLNKTSQTLGEANERVPDYLSRVGI